MVIFNTFISFASLTFLLLFFFYIRFSLSWGHFEQSGWSSTLAGCMIQLKPNRILFSTWATQVEAPSSVKWSEFQFSHSVVSHSLWSHGVQHIRIPSPSPTPGVYSNSCALNRWCHPTISSSVIPFSSHLQSFPASGSFQMSQIFASGGQSIGVSASASVFPVNIQDWFLLGWTGWISLQSNGLSRVFSNTTVQKPSAFLIVQLSHPYMTTGKTTALTRQTFVGKVMSLFFNMLSMLVIAFLPSSKCLHFMAAVTICSDFGAQNNKVSHCFHYFSIYLP